MYSLLEMRKDNTRRTKTLNVNYTNFMGNSKMVRNRVSQNKVWLQLSLRIALVYRNQIQRIQHELTTAMQYN